jgi:hypothetical protein
MILSDLANEELMVQTTGIARPGVRLCLALVHRAYEGTIQNSKKVRRDCMRATLTCGADYEAHPFACQFVVTVPS